MKVGTDAVLLGAWTDIPTGRRALDIGTGCGVIALLLANRDSSLQITALDLDEPSVAEAHANFMASPWCDRFWVVNDSLQSFSKQHLPGFDLIVSNPPWFQHCLRVPGNARRNNARHGDTLNYEDLLAGATRLAMSTTVFSLVLPFAEASAFSDQASGFGWFLHRRCKIVSLTGRPPYRQLLQFGKSQGVSVQESTLEIQHADGTFTSEYRDLTKQFYLNF